MKFTVLINNYNNAPFLEECIESGLQQERPADEIIVVDDGSTDSSREILEKYQQHPFVKIIYQENQGQTTAVATGIDHAEGDILFLLDGDDIYHTNHLAALEKRWLQYPDADLIYCRCDYADATRGHIVINSLIGEVQNPEEPYEWGYTAILAHSLPWYFLGSVTSTISLRKEHALENFK
jgi:glycosyltransferase involved in cell wall biosynthesis